MLQIRLNRLTKKLCKNTDGATAIEFSILALPFMLLIFGILELALVFFTTTSLQHNLATSTRDLRVGESGAICGDIDRIEELVCDGLDIQNCRSNLAINVTRISSNQFDAAALSQFQGGGFTLALDANGDETTEIDLDGFRQFATGIQGDEIVIAKAIYQHELILPGRFTGLSTSGLGEKRAISVTQAIRTEPFPDVTCP